MRIAFAVSANQSALHGLEGENRLVTPLLEAAGIRVESPAWDDPSVDWRSYSLVMLHTAWGYDARGEAFAAWLERMRAEGVRLVNPVATVLWNLHKSYLLQLEARGVAIVPTRLTRAGEMPSLPGSWDEVIVKPAISAGGRNMERLSLAAGPEALARALASLEGKGDVLIQPYLPEIQEGEISLLFFGGRFSHAVRKTPSGGEYRIHTRYGGVTRAYPPEPSLLRTAEHILSEASALVGETPLYARVDGVMQGGQFLLMELELIEPWFYLADTPDPEGAGRRFAEGVIGVVRGGV